MTKPQLEVNLIDALAKFRAQSTAQAKREEFWDTRVEGRAEMWQAIKLSVQAGDEATARVIMQSAGLTSWDVDKSDSCFCYDEASARPALHCDFAHHARCWSVFTARHALRSADVRDARAPQPDPGVDSGEDAGARASAHHWRCRRRCDRNARRSELADCGACERNNKRCCCYCAGWCCNCRCERGEESA